MPTGFTEAIYEGGEVTFREFALKCAKAFIRSPDGDSVSLRKVSIPTYWDDMINDQKRELDRLRSMSDEQADVEYAKFLQIEQGKSDQINEFRDRLKASYHDMVREVEAWTPPTEEHNKLKELMLDQLAQSIVRDCARYTLMDTMPLYSSGRLWKMDRIAQTISNMERTEQSKADEIAAITANNQWIDDLERSLP